MTLSPNVFVHTVKKEKKINVFILPFQSHKPLGDSAFPRALHELRHRGWIYKHKATCESSSSQWYPGRPLVTLEQGPQNNNLSIQLKKGCSVKHAAKQKEDGAQWKRGLTVHLSLPFCLCLCLVLWGSSQFQNGPKAQSYKIVMCEEGGRKAFSQSQLSGPLSVMAGDKMKSSQFHGFRAAEPMALSCCLQRTPPDGNQLHAWPTAM